MKLFITIYSNFTIAYLYNKEDDFIYIQIEIFNYVTIVKNMHEY